MVDWKKVLIPALVLGLGLSLLFAQFRYQWVSFANIWSSRIYIMLCIGIISLGHALTQTKPTSQWQHGLSMFIIMNIVLFMFGGFGQLNDAINGTTMTEGSGIWMGFDVLSTPFTSKAIEFAIIVQTIVGTLPAIILIFSVVSIWTADSPDEYGSAMMEFAMVLIILILFSFFGNLFGFAWV